MLIFNSIVLLAVFAYNLMMSNPLGFDPPWRSTKKTAFAVFLVECIAWSYGNFKVLC